MFRPSRSWSPHRWLAVLAATAAMVLGLPAGPAQVEAATLPGGKANFVVAQGYLVASSRQNWTRLATYQFSTSGTVTARGYLWWQRYPKARVGTGTTPDSSCSTLAGPATATRVRTCQIRTAGGYTGSPTESRSGTFTTSTQNVGGVPTVVVTITWNIGQTWSEQWYVRPSPDGRLVKLDFKYNTLATHGYGYGSNAAINTRRPMSTVRAHPATLRQDLVSWSGGRVVTSTGQVFGLPSFRTCSTTTWCLTYLQPSSSGACQASGGCPNYGGGSPANVSSIQYYLQSIASYDRRDTLWHWCTCLAMERNQFCYTGNSHVKPLLQIIDDAGGFRGWVGAEASFYNSSSSDPRRSDMIAVFRLADFR